MPLYADLRDTGIAAVGEMPWGTHFCHFYETPHDLLDTVIPYLRSGLKNREQCLWVTGKPLGRKTRDAVRRAIPGIDEHVSAGNIRILPYSQWYLDKDGGFHARRVMAAWDEALERALDKGYAGLRAVADEAWLGIKYWQAFADYEQQLDEPIARQRMIVMCAYPLGKCQGCAIFDVARTHQFAIAERHGSWQTLETPALKHAKADLQRLNDELESRVLDRTCELAAANEALLQEMRERRRAEETRARLAAVVESSDDAIVSETLGGRILTWNAGAEHLYGYPAGEAIGRSNAILVPADRLGELDDILRRIGRGERIEHFETVRLRRDGTPVEVSVTFSPVRDSRGDIIGASAIARDITERKRMEAERRMREAAESASRAKGEFVAHMNHELRSPLNIILGFAQLLTHEPLPEQARRDLGTILSSGEHLLTLINNVLDLSKIEAGRAELAETHFDLHRLLDNLEDMFALRAQQQGIELVFERGGDVPRWIKADDMKLRQVLINLLSNALKFTRAGRVTAAVQGSGSPGRLAFAIADTGPGIVPGELKQLFAPFVQAEAGRRTGEGSGLGLAISRSFVRLMGGELEIDSQPGHGVTAHFEIPVQILAEQPALPAKPGGRVVALAPGQPPRRLLVVDDRHDAREMLVRLLEPVGLQVAQAADGLAAIDVCRSWQPDLVWMDLRMPGLDGLEATRRIKGLAAGAPGATRACAASTARTPVVIALTASTYEERRDELLAAGFDDFQSKPFREEDIFNLLERHLDVRFVREGDSITRGVPRLETGQFAALPPALRTRLARALVELDTAGVEQALDAVRRHDERIAQSLAIMAAEYQYEQMLKLLQEAPPAPG